MNDMDVILVSLYIFKRLRKVVPELNKKFSLLDIKRMAEEELAYRKKFQGKEPISWDN